MHRRWILTAPWIATLALAAAVILQGRVGERSNETARASEGARVADWLSSGADQGFARADERREFRFPEDHFAHDGFATEWWYVTGNLQTEDARGFGFQLTFFRSAWSAEPRRRDSRLAADHAWMAHFALSDLAGRRFHSFERFGREGPLARASADDGGVFLRDWKLAFDAKGQPARLIARQAGVAIDLDLTPTKPPILNGDGGLSVKNSDAGNASYYYSMTRIAASGRVTLDEREFTVRGNAWLDREWMSASLSRDQIGWDWFALTLDDGSELMWYRLRRKDGGTDPFRSGTFVAADGSSRRLAAEDVELRSAGSWTSPRSGADYPTRWTLNVAALGLALEIESALDDQELDVGFRYFEGAVRVRGQRAGKPLLGSGYVELVGYGDAVR